MKLLASLLVLPLVLAGCSKETGTPSAPASPVAAVSAPAGQNWTDTVSRTAEGTIVGNPAASGRASRRGNSRRGRKPTR